MDPSYPPRLRSPIRLSAYVYMTDVDPMARQRDDWLSESTARRIRPGPHWGYSRPRPRRNNNSKNNGGDEPTPQGQAETVQTPPRFNRLDGKVQQGANPNPSLTNPCVCQQEECTYVRACEHARAVAAINLNIFSGQVVQGITNLR
jgi:hypothetical protein